MHILIVEDNLVNQKLFQRYLQKIGGCTFFIAEDGQQALNYLSSPPTTHPRPDIIFMDLQMPIMDGYTATQILRTQPPFIADPKIPSTPIIALAPRLSRPELDRLEERGFDDHLQKPVRVITLRKMILFWSRRRVFPRPQPGVLAVARPRNVVVVPPAAQWGPVPLRPFRGPRSLL